MKKTYIKPACELAATATCAPIASSIDFSNQGEKNASEGNGNYGGNATGGTWAASKGNSFNVWESDEDEE